MCSPLMASADRVLGLLYVDNLTTTEHLHRRGPAVPGGVQRPRRDRHQEHPLRRADPARGARCAPTSSATSRPTSRPRSRSRARPSGRAASAGRPPCSSATSAASPRWPSRMGPDAIAQLLSEYFTRDGGGDLRARRHARQVHRRRDHGPLGRAHRAHRRSRPRAARGARDAARHRPAQRALGRARAGRRSASGSGSTTARCSPATSGATAAWSTP